jgi:PAS domain S-box-containing protein
VHPTISSSRAAVIAASLADTIISIMHSDAVLAPPAGRDIAEGGGFSPRSPTSPVPPILPTCKDTYDALAQYHQLATDSITDAQNWVRACSLARAIPEAMPDAIVVVDEAGLIVSVNAQFELMFGYHRSQVIGQPPEMLMPEAFRQCHIDLSRGFIHDPSARDLEGKVLARRKNGVEIQVEIRLGPVVTPDGAFIIATIRRVRD